MEKSNNGKKMILILIIIILLLIIGYLFGKQNKEIQLLKDANGELQNKIDELSNNEMDTNTDNNAVSNEVLEEQNIVGYYKYKKLVSGQNECDMEYEGKAKNMVGQTLELKLEDDGTYKYHYLCICGSGLVQSGTYTTTDNILTLNCNSDDGEQCTEIVRKFIINQNGTLTGIEHNSEVLNKVTENDIQLLED